ncbi:Rv0361 family membrane protein [Nocardia sp. CA-119907]|uniref:Rv0361 family membrane protein n=1 Tax=Nocardia sp. CA-119907 TaxID=3239973 RepID=UPI003D97948B
MIRRDSNSGSTASADASADQVDDAGADAATTVMPRIELVKPSAGTKDAATASTPPEEAGGDEPDLAGADDKTVAMPVVSRLDAEKTMALPIQRPVDKDATQRMRTDAKPGTTDRVVPSAARPGPVAKPPSTPRPAAGPKQAGAQGPPQGPGVEDTAPSPPRPPARQRQVASAPSPADTQLTRPAQPVQPRPPQPRPMAQPQRITPPAQPADAAAAEAPAGSKRRLFVVLGAAAVAVIAVITLAVVLIGNRGDNSPEAKVRASITDYTEALKSGDLAALRKSTCGQLHDFYQGIPEDQFAGVHRLSLDRKNIPVVASVDAIRITDKTAIAQATVYTDADPSKRSARTFDLERTDDGWKVCDPPTAGTP